MGEQSEELGNWIAAWRRAEARAREAEERVISAYTRYVAGDGALPPLTWESDVAMLRLEANRRIERIYSAARRIRKPTAADFRESVPGAMGGRVDMEDEP